MPVSARPFRAFPATVEAWTDGDTGRFLVSLGFYCTTRQVVRLLAQRGPADAYEMRSRYAHERELAKKARARAAELAPPGASVVLHVTKADGFGRFLSRVELADGRDLGDVLWDEGLMRAYVRAP